MEDKSKGQQGTPGEDAHGTVGGQGGTGGAGGEGQEMGGAGGSGGPGGSVMGKHKGDLQRALWIVAIGTAVLFCYAISVGVYAYVANSHRINDIQESRLSSCQRTYGAFHQVFDPFLPPKEDRTAKQKHDIAKFDKTINRLVTSCSTQVSTSN